MEAKEFGQRPLMIGKTGGHGGCSVNPMDLGRGKPEWQA